VKVILLYRGYQASSTGDVDFLVVPKGRVLYAA